MGKSNSNLLNYIDHLLDPRNESQLRDFVVDPITDAEQEWGLTKAERAVLRRTVAGLSNNAANGYSIDRSLSSYRRSLRMLQNVLHKNAAHAVHDHLAGESEDATPSFYTFVLYVPHASDDNNYTGKTNAAVDSNGGPYSRYDFWSISASKVVDNPSIADVMYAIRGQGIKSVFQRQTLEFTDVSPNDSPNLKYVLSFDFEGVTFTANLIEPNGEPNPEYSVQPGTHNDNVFWFYTLDGGPNKDFAPNPAFVGISGEKGVAYNTQPANQSKNGLSGVIVWQLIAPDLRYGYQSCIVHPRNAFGKAKAKAAREPQKA